ncbi:MAG TPA: PrsW family glutamic-type intramembrane protease [Rhodothermales bacterium]
MNLLITLAAIAFGTGIWLYILRRYDRIEPEALKYLVTVALVGGLASVMVSALLNELVSSVLGVRSLLFTDGRAASVWALLVFCVFVGFNEEIWKATATVFTTRRFADLNEPIDAMIYAMTVGLGFASIENLIYATRFGNEVLLVRFLWPVPAHMAYAAVWGYGLAKARFIHPRRSRIRTMAPSVIVAGLFHAGANFLLFLQETVPAVLSLVAIAVLAYIAHLRLVRLVAESPFLEPGECPVCRNLNQPNAEVCVHCGAPLQNTEMFVTCPCGRARIPAHAERCTECGLSIAEARRMRMDARSGVTDR